MIETAHELFTPLNADAVLCDPCDSSYVVVALYELTPESGSRRGGLFFASAADADPPSQLGYSSRPDGILDIVFLRSHLLACATSSGHLVLEALERQHSKISASMSSSISLGTSESDVLTACDSFQ